MWRVRARTALARICHSVEARKLCQCRLTSSLTVKGSVSTRSSLRRNSCIAGVAVYQRPAWLSLMIHTIYSERDQRGDFALINQASRERQRPEEA